MGYPIVFSKYTRPASSKQEKSITQRWQAGSNFLQAFPQLPTRNHPISYKKFPNFLQGIYPFPLQESTQTLTGKFNFLTAIDSMPIRKFFAAKVLIFTFYDSDKNDMRGL
jgi:hypothetical protein